MSNFVNVHTLFDIRKSSYGAISLILFFYYDTLSKHTYSLNHF